MPERSPNVCSMKRTLRVAGVVNLWLALLLFLGMSITLGWNAMVITDRYSECYNRGLGIIDVDKLREFHNGAYANGEFALLGDFLLAGPYSSLPGYVYFSISVLVAANGAFLIWRSRKMPEDQRQ